MLVPDARGMRMLVCWHCLGTCQPQYLLAWVFVGLDLYRSGHLVAWALVGHTLLDGRIVHKPLPSLSSC